MHHQQQLRLRVAELGVEDVQHAGMAHPLRRDPLEVAARLQPLLGTSFHTDDPLSVSQPRRAIAIQIPSATKDRGRVARTSRVQ
jgi:hypothetical protein